MMQEQSRLHLKSKVFKKKQNKQTNLIFKNTISEFSLKNMPHRNLENKYIYITNT